MTACRSFRDLGALVTVRPNPLPSPCPRAVRVRGDPLAIALWRDHYGLKVPLGYTVIFEHDCTQTRPEDLTLIRE